MRPGPALPDPLLPDAVAGRCARRHRGGRCRAARAAPRTTSWAPAIVITALLATGAARASARGAWARWRLAPCSAPSSSRSRCATTSPDARLHRPQLLRQRCRPWTPIARTRGTTCASSTTARSSTASSTCSRRRSAEPTTYYGADLRNRTGDLASNDAERQEGRPDRSGRRHARGLRARRGQLPLLRDQPAGDRLRAARVQLHARQPGPTSRRCSATPACRWSGSRRRASTSSRSTRSPATRSRCT